MLLYLTYWFPAERRGRVTAIFLAAIPAATIVGGPLSGWSLVTGVGLVATAVSLDSTVLAVASTVLVAAGVSTAQAAFWAMSAGFLTGTGAAAGIALIDSIGNIGGAVSTSLVGVLSDVTGSTAASLYPFGVVLVVGGLLVLLVPRSVNDTAVAAPARDTSSQA